MPNILLYICCTTTATSIVCSKEETLQSTQSTAAHTHARIKSSAQHTHTAAHAMNTLINVSIWMCVPRQCKRFNVTVQWTLFGDQLVMSIYIMADHLWCKHKRKYEPMTSLRMCQTKLSGEHGKEIQNSKRFQQTNAIQIAV